MHSYFISNISGLASRMLCLHELPGHVGRSEVRLAPGQAVLRKLLRRVVRQAVHGLHEAHHRGRRNEVRDKLFFTKLNHFC